MKTEADVLIVGAGMSGLVAAKALAAAGADLIVVDKARGVGGRMASRRSGSATYDTGAQFITVRDQRFQHLVDQMVAADAATEWFRAWNSRSRSEPRYRGVPAMTGPAKWLASGLDVRLGVRLAAAYRGPDGRWVADGDEGRTYRAAAILLTPPVPQSLAMLEAGHASINVMLADRLRSVEYHPSLAVIGRLDKGIIVGAPGIVTSGSSIIDWIADNHAKGVSDTGPAMTIHCSHTYSREAYDAPDEVVVSAVESALPRDLVGPLEDPQVKRWRYARPTNCLADEAVADIDEKGLFFAGDAFSAARVEGAAVSGMKAAELIAGFLGLNGTPAGRGERSSRG